MIEEGHIRSVESAGPVPEGAAVVDGAGMYFVPGLWDMHAHVRHPEAPTLILPHYWVATPRGDGRPRHELGV